MSIPGNIAYAAPLEDLPASRATWSLEQSRAAVLVHDMQRYFLRVFDPASPAIRDAVERSAQIVRAARATGVPVFYTAQTGTQHDVVRGLQGDLWGPGMQPIDEHTAIVEELAPAEGDRVLVKHRYDAFAHSELGELLDADGRDQLVICGVYAHIGITATAFTAFQREIQPFVVADAVADFGAAEHRRALEQVASCSGRVITAGEVLTAFVDTAITEE